MVHDVTVNESTDMQSSIRLDYLDGCCMHSWTDLSRLIFFLQLFNIRHKSRYNLSTFNAYSVCLGT